MTSNTSTDNTPHDTDVSNDTFEVAIAYPKDIENPNNQSLFLKMNKNNDRGFGLSVYHNKDFDEAFSLATKGFNDNAAHEIIRSVDFAILDNVVYTKSKKDILNLSEHLSKLHANKAVQAFLLHNVEWFDAGSHLFMTEYFKKNFSYQSWRADKNKENSKRCHRKYFVLTTDSETQDLVVHSRLEIFRIKKIEIDDNGDPQTKMILERPENVVAPIILETQFRLSGTKNDNGEDILHITVEKDWQYVSKEVMHLKVPGLAAYQEKIPKKGVDSNFFVLPKVEQAINAIAMNKKFYDQFSVEFLVDVAMSRANEDEGVRIAERLLETGVFYSWRNFKSKNLTADQLLALLERFQNHLPIVNQILKPRWFGQNFTKLFVERAHMKKLWELKGQIDIQKINSSLYKKMGQDDVNDETSFSLDEALGDEENEQDQQDQQPEPGLGSADITNSLNENQMTCPSDSSDSDSSSDDSGIDTPPPSPPPDSGISAEDLKNLPNIKSGHEVPSNDNNGSQPPSVKVN